MLYFSMFIILLMVISQSACYLFYLIYLLFKKFKGYSIIKNEILMEFQNSFKTKSGHFGRFGG